MAGIGAGGAAGGGGPLAGLAAAVAGNGLLAIAAGLIVGVIGSGTLLATGAVHVGGGNAAPAAPVAGLQVVACPNVGPVIGTIPQGEKVLVTGRTEDGTWLQVFYPGPAFDRAWTRAGPLRLEADPGGLPVASCEAPPSPSPRPTPGASTAVVPSPEASPSPAASPSPSPAVSPSPSPSPSLKPSPSPSPSLKPSPSPTPTPNVPPALAGLSASTATISYDQGGYCPTARKAATITVTASDVSGLASVTLFWRKPGAASYSSKPMVQSGGTWQAPLSTAADGITVAGTLAYYVVAKDTTGATSRLPKSGAASLAIKVCANTGPTFTAQPSAAVTTLNSDPTGKGCGQQLGTAITAAATDPDGVASMTLYFTGPGLGGTVSRPMTLNGSVWTGSINTGSDKIVGSGTITFYAIAADTKGATTQSKSGSINVIACGSPASIQVVITSPPTVRGFIFINGDCGVAPSVDFSITASDPDNGTQQLTVGLTWGLVNNSSGSVDSARAKVSADAGTAYSASIGSTRTSTWLTPAFFGSNVLAYTVTATDRFGGVTTFTGKATVMVSNVCQLPG